MSGGGSRSCPAARTYAVHLDEENRVLVATTPEAPREELLAAAVSPAIEVTTAAFDHIKVHAFPALPRPSHAVLP